MCDFIENIKYSPYEKIINRIMCYKICPNPDWVMYNNKKETKELVKNFGDYTPHMINFMKIYENNLWGKGSGNGSSICFAAHSIIMLKVMLELLGVDILIDLPCGDQQWIYLLRDELPDLKYIGVDIVPGVIQYNIENFSKSGQIEFFLNDLETPEVFNLIKKKSKIWNENSIVAVLTRHTLEHNTLKVSYDYLNSLKKAPINFFIGTNQWNVEKNVDIMPGEYTPRNYYMEPYNLPRGIVSWPEHEIDRIYGSTMLEIWDMKLFPTNLV